MKRRNILETVREGGVILYPSDTLWGIGGDARSDGTVRRIKKIKNRPDGKGLVVLVSDLEMLQKYVEEIPGEAVEIIEKSLRPTTIIYPRSHGLSREVCAPDGSVAIRIVKKGFARDLIKTTGIPLVSTSANISGKPAPLSFNDIEPAILESVDYVVNLHRQKISGRPSRIVRINASGEVEIIRD